MADGTGPGVPNEGPPAGQLVLTDPDIERLANAIKRGNEPQRPTFGNVLSDGIVLLLGIGFLVGAWTVLNHLRPAVSASYSEEPTLALSMLKTLDLGSVRPGVSWSLGAAASAVHLSAGASNKDVLYLPVTTAACQQIDTALGLGNLGRCHNGELTTAADLFAVWSSPQPVYLQSSTATEQASTVDLELLQPAAPGAPSAVLAPSAALGNTTVRVTQTGNQPTEWCTPDPTTSATLEIKTIAGSFTVPKGDFVSTSCPQGLAIATSPVPNGATPPFADLVGTTSFTCQATTASVVAGGLSGTLQLGGASYRLGTPADVTLVTHSGGLQANLQFLVEGDRADGSGLTILGQASGAWNGPTNLEPNLVTSWWDRESSISIPLFIALCGLFFNLVARLLSDAQKRWLPFSDEPGPTSASKARS
jgi:hypothetical protein